MEAICQYGHDYTKKYGGHNYPNKDGTSDCSHGCGCWAGPSRSGGPIGIDPFGTCPKNPVDGKCLGGNADNEVIVHQRISGIKTRLFRAESALKKVSPSKKALAEKLGITEQELSLAKEKLAGIIQLAAKK